MLPFLLACSGPTADTGPVVDTADHSADYTAAGPHPVGRSTHAADDAGRALTIEVWYPATERGAGGPITDLVDGEDRAAYSELLASAPAGCPSTTVAATADLPVAPGPWPVVALSHCHGCTRFSTAAAAEHLASHGFVVVAPDHAGNTLFDALAGEGLPLDTDTLALRVGDLGFALDLALAGTLGVEVDAGRVGVMGHSFGAVTAAALLQERSGGTAAPRSAMLIGAPAENPLLPGVDMATFDAPVLFELLEEDHSVGLAGNILIEANFEEAPGPARLARVADAGHWSPSDLVGLYEPFLPGCGEDTRQEGGAAFTYLPPADGRAITGALAAAFFAETLDGAAGAGAWLDEAGGDERVAVTTK